MGRLKAQPSIFAKLALQPAWLICISNVTCQGKRMDTGPFDCPLLPVARSDRIQKTASVRVGGSSGWQASEQLLQHGGVARQGKRMDIFACLIYCLMRLRVLQEKIMLHAGGSSGWQAPEQLLQRGGGVARQGKRMDIFPYACLLYHLLTGGGHPFGESLERDYNILQVACFDAGSVAYCPHSCVL